MTVNHKKITSLLDGVETEQIKADTLSMHDLAGSCKECITLHKKEFLEIFHVDIRRFMSGINFLLGFDIVGFDKQVIKTEDNISMSDTIKDKYGDRANRLIDEILQYPKI